MSVLECNTGSIFLRSLEAIIFAQASATALSDWTRSLFGLVLLVLVIQILFIQIVLVGKIMGNSRYMLLFLFLAGSLLLPTLSGTFDRSEPSQQPGDSAKTSSTDEKSSPVTSEMTELRKERQSVAVVPVQSQPVRPVPIRVAAPATQPVRKPAAQPVVARSLNSQSSGQGQVQGHASNVTSHTSGPRRDQMQTVSSSDNNAKFTTVSQPYDATSQSYNGTANPNNTAQRPQPVTLRGNIPSRNTVGNQGQFGNGPNGTYARTPVPLGQAPSNNTQSGPVTASPIPNAIQNPDSGVSSTGFSIPKQPIPLPGMPQPGTQQGGFPSTQSQGNIDSFRYLLEYLSEVMHQGVAAARPAVVHIVARVHKESSMGKRREVEETGCGVLSFLQQRFFVITNAHVAGRAVAADQVRITLANKHVIHPVRILTCNEVDIALLEIDPSSLPADILQGTADVRVAKFGNSDAVRVPDTVLTIGSPFGLPGSVSRGVLSGRERRRIPLGNKSDQIQDFLQTDAAVNPGNSGGPLLNVSGEVIGIVTAIATNSGGSEGVAFAQPINNVLLIANQLITQGVFRRPYMGVELDPEFDSHARAQYGLSRAIGTRIIEVSPRSPADRAGLKAGDVILRYNGVEVQDDQHLVQLIGLSQIGQTPQISVLRNSSQILITPQLITTSSAAIER
ncbi:MAG: trypsin-like peptidase domain-containing protein [Planctomycetia bacterium]|nr:trypsin-like peptidase domain-containing protein [Planctomycetia bacterium]